MPFACRSGVIAARLGLKYNRAKESNEKTPRQAAKRLSIATAHEPHLTERRSRKAFPRPFHDFSRLRNHLCTLSLRAWGYPSPAEAKRPPAGLGPK